MKVVPYWRNALEMGNGVWALLALWVIVFLTYHIFWSIKLHWKEVKYHELPLSLQLSIGVWVMSFAVLHTRGTVWYIRYTHGGDLSMRDFETGWFLFGIFIGIVGFLCVLRAITRPNFGYWPWLGAIMSVAGYLAWWGSNL